MASPAVEHPEPYDLLDYRHLAENVVRALMEQPCSELPPSGKFIGAGVYAIYYTGGLECYSAVRGENTPIYVGSAVPAGKRKGGTSAGRSATLHKRLSQYAKSIAQAENLDLADLRCRYLVVVPVWISLAERFLIEHFRPLWNTVVDGFGNHDPGKGRYSGKRPRWDILHPGRSWAENLQAEESPDDILKDIT